MRRQRQWMGWSVGAMGLVLLAGCGGADAGPLAANSRRGPREGSGALLGRVLLLRSGPDSGSIPLAGVTVALERLNIVDSFPDTTGACCDSLPGGMGPLMDSIHGDTIITPPPPPPPVDSIPPDSTPPPPPPPPPPGGCFAAGEPAGTTTTDARGRFAFRGLRAGLYNVLAHPSDPNVFVANLCGLRLRTNQQLEHLVIAVIPQQQPESLVVGTR